MADRFVVPATVEHYPLSNGRSRLSLLWSNGQRGKLHGPAAEIRQVHSILLQGDERPSRDQRRAVPLMKIGSGYEHDW